MGLVRRGVMGWVMHARDVPGRPDFVFPDLRVAVFVDGCFWHGCRRCGHTAIKNNALYWREKIEGNVRRDRKTDRSLRRGGWTVIRIWEHQISASLEKVIEEVAAAASP